MSKMAKDKQERRARRSFTDEFKAGAVRLVLEEGKTIPQVARDLDLTESALRTWVEHTRADRSNGKTGPAQDSVFVLLPQWSRNHARYA